MHGLNHLLCLLLAMIILLGCDNSTTIEVSPAASNDPDMAEANTYAIEKGWRFGTKTKDSGHVISRGSFVNGQKDGAWIEYHNRDQKFGPIIETMTTYKNGVKHGAEMKIDPSGRVQEMAFYVNGKLQGPRSKYQHTSTVEEVTYKDGILHGPKKTYYQTGTLQMEVNFKNGKRHGTERFYNQQGDIMMQNEFDNGVKQ